MGEDGVRRCTNFLLYFTEGVTSSTWCQMELRWAVEHRKNIILVGETDERHGKVEIEDLIDEAPEDLRQVFHDHVVIPWYRDPDFRRISLNKICEAAVISRRR